jgi:hypothetical protein
MKLNNKKQLAQTTKTCMNTKSTIENITVTLLSKLQPI